MRKFSAHKGVAILTLFLTCFLLTAPLWGKEPLLPLRIGEKTYRLLIADTPEKWERGLMFRSAMDEDGMIFLFPGKQVRNFWNKNTYLDLDVYWMDGDKVVGKGYLPSIKKSGKIVSIFSPGPVDRVVEIVIRDSSRQSR